MTKNEFINTVSKIDQTGEDEFKAEFNSPEKIWPFICSSNDNIIHKLNQIIDTHTDGNYLFCSSVKDKMLSDILDLFTRKN